MEIDPRELPFAVHPLAMDAHDPQLGWPEQGGDAEVLRAVHPGLEEEGAVVLEEPLHGPARLGIGQSAGPFLSIYRERPEAESGALTTQAGGAVRRGAVELREGFHHPGSGKSAADLLRDLKAEGAMMDGGDDGRRGVGSCQRRSWRGASQRDRGGEARTAAVRHGLGRLAPGKDLVGWREIAERPGFEIADRGPIGAGLHSRSPSRAKTRSSGAMPGDGFQNGAGRRRPATREVVLGEEVGEDAPHGSLSSRPPDELRIEPRRLAPLAVEGPRPGPCRAQRPGEVGLEGVPGGLVLPLRTWSQVQPKRTCSISSRWTRSITAAVFGSPARRAASA